MKSRILSAARPSSPLASAIVALLAAPVVFGAGGPFYWDNLAGAGFGTAGGTWSSAGTASKWNTSSTGADSGLQASLITDTTDTLNFGTGTTGNGLALGTITVSGTVNAGNLTFGSQSGNITFSGTLGTAKVNLAATSTINTGGKTITFSDVSLNGSSNLTYTGGGVLAIKANSSTLTGDLFVLDGTVRLFNPSSGSGNLGLGGASGPKITLGNTSGSSATTLEVNNSITVANAIAIRAGSSGLKTLGLGSAIGAIYSGTITASDNLRVLNDVAGTGGSVSVSGTGSSIASGKIVTWSHLTSGAINDTGTWSGLGAFSYSGTGNTGDITVSGAKTYSGGATLGTMNSTGNLVVNANSSGPANAPTSGPFGTGTLTIGATKMRAKTSDRTIANPITFNGNPTFDTDAAETSLLFSGNADLGAATRTLTVSTGTSVAGKVVNFSGVISSATAASGITKAGAGTLTLSGANTYTGDTTVTGGTLNISGIYTGNTTSSSLVLGTTAAKTVVNVSNNMTLFGITGANISGSSTAYNQTAGTVNISPAATTDAFVAKIGYGYFNLTGGTYKQNSGRFSVTDIGATATGVAYVGGTGILDVTSTSTMIVGYSGTGSLTVGTGGSILRNGAPSQFWLTTNAGSVGTLNLAGGTIDNGTAAAAAIRVGNGTAGPQTGTINLAKGTLTMGQTIVSQVTGTGTNLYANYTGGTLKASATLAAVLPVSSSAITVTSTAFGPIDNPGTTEDFAGGLTIDTNGFSVTHGAAILGATGNGVKQSNLTITGGSDYIGAPMVTFTGGTGTPASGYAVISGGAVTGIVITSPGNYSADPTGVTLSGGGGTGASVTLSPLTANPTDSGLTKISPGTLTLTNTNTYVGPTTVTGGTLRFSTGTASSPTDVTVAGGAEFGVLVGSTDGQWDNTTGDLTLQNNAGVLIDYGSTAPSTTVAPIKVTDFTVGTSAIVRFAGGTLSSLQVGTPYPLVSWTGTGPIDGSAFTLNTHRLTGTFSVSSGTLFFTATTNSAGSPISWNTGNGDWDTSTSNWVDANLPPVATIYYDTLDPVLFGDAAGASGNPVVTLAAPYSPLGVTMNSTGHDYTVSGAGSIGGSGTLTLAATNTRTLTLATANNTFSGGTTVNGGTLVLGDATDTLPNAGAVTVDGASAILSLGANSDTVGTVSLKNGATITGSGGTLTATSYAVESGSASAILGGTGALTKTTAGTVTLSAANTMTGTTIIDEGTLVFSSANQSLTGGLTFGAAANSTNTGTLDLSGVASSATFTGAMLVRTNSTAANTITLAAGKTLTINGGLTMSNTTNNAETRLTMTGGGAFVVNGASMTVGSNSGGTNISGEAHLDMAAIASFTTTLSGNLIIQAAGDNGFGSNPASMTLSNGANSITAASLRVGNSSNGSTNTLWLGGSTNLIQTDLINLGAGNRDTGVIDFAGTGGSVTLRDVAGTGRVASVNLGPQTAQATAYTTASLIDLTGNTADIAIGTFATSLGAKAAANTNDLRFDTGTLDIRSINMAFAKGTGSSDNRITIGGGTVRLGGSTAFSDAGTGTLTLATAGSGELIINGGTVTSTVSLLKGTGGTGTATVTLNGGTLDMSGTNIGAATDTVVLAAQSGTLKNVAQINNGATLTKSTAGTLILDGTNTYTGNTTVDAGILSQTSANTSNESSTVTIAASGATLNLNFFGTDTVDKLFIGGTQMAAGVYGPSATNIAQITGTGTLNVTTGPAGYDSWKGANAGNQDPNLDFDNDGVSNGVEYFMNAAAGFTANPQLIGSTITWPNGGNIPASAYGSQFVVQTSPDLLNWTDVPVGQLVTNTDGPGGSLTYTLTGPGPRFVRLKVKPN